MRGFARLGKSGKSTPLKNAEHECLRRLENSKMANARVNANIRFLTGEPRKHAQTGSERLPSAVERVETFRWKNKFL